MITEPSVEKLDDKADSPYTLVILAAKRARHINLTDKELLDEYKGAKPVSKSLQEIDAGKITYKKNRTNSNK
jgi:DNA-directed RNA polymerase subunit omega